MFYFQNSLSFSICEIFGPKELAVGPALSGRFYARDVKVV